MKSQAYTREELYNLVWQNPVKHLAKELGYKEKNIRDVCKKHNIPLPKMGYWSKLKFNKEVTKTPLPESENQESVIRIEYDKEGKVLENSLSKSQQELTFKFPEYLNNPDPSIKAAKEDLKNKKPNPWSDIQGMITTSPGIINISISKPLIKRALLFMDTFIKLLKKNGHKVEIENGSKIILYDMEYKIHLREKYKRIKIMNKYGWEDSEKELTGNLTLKLYSYIPINEWSDSKTKPLESKIYNIIAWIEKKAKEDKEWEIQSEIDSKKREIQRKKEEALQKLKDDELLKFNTLFETASRWQKSQYLRNYIKEFKSYAIKTDSLDDEKNKWIEWAKEKADWYDPFVEKEVELLEDIDRETLKKKYKRYW